MRVHRRRLRLDAGEGCEVNAAADIRQRRILLARRLTRHPGELARILIHEVFHFAWVRLGNARRRSFEELLAAELARHARGELGWSSETRKSSLSGVDRTTRTRRWREYLGESFCDTAAWFYAGVAPHEEFTLAQRWRERRTRWFRNFCRPGGQVAV